MSLLDRGGGRGGTSSSGSGVLGTGTTIARRAPGTASTASTASLSHATSLKSAAPPSENPYPVVTYRHLLSAGSLTPANPLRVIAHCDVDAAYAQFEAARLGIDSFAVPLAVQQWQGLIAISYKAREYGINRHCDIQKAKELCPELVKVHVQTIAPGQKEAAYNEDPRPETHKVSLDPYRRESRKILASFKATCPLGQVEKASIDESFFDLTLEVRRLLLTRYPHLKQAPKTGKGMDEPLPAPPMIEWDDCGELMPIKRLNEEGDPIDREDEGFVPSQEHQLLHPTWTDVALAHGAKLMSKVRKNVFDQLGYTTSAGIASNKTLSKLCSGYRKPNQQTTLLPRAVPAYLRDLPVSSIRFLGGKLGREMGDMWEAKTVGDLWSVPLESMQAHFGPEAAWVHAVLRGVDHAPVSARIANKTMLASKNLRPVIRRRHEALGWLDTLSTELVTRLKELWEDERGAMEESNVQSVFEEELKKESVGASNSPYKASKAPALPTLWPKFLVLRFIRVRDGPRSRQAAFPYVGNLTSEEVYKVAVRLWNEACDEMRIEPSSSLTANTDQQIGGGVEIVTIALGFSGLERAETGQKSIEGFFKAGAAGNGKRKREEDVNDSTKDAKEHNANTRSWTCEECGQTVSVPIQTTDTSQAPPAHDSEEFFDNDNPFSGDQADSWTGSSAVDDAQRRLDVQIQDHRDWHFAVKLSNSNDWQDNDSSSTTQQSTQQSMHRSNPHTQQATKKPAKKVKKGSLQSFFAKQGPSS